jgi:hypothetical protein
VEIENDVKVRNDLITQESGYKFSFAASNSPKHLTVNLDRKVIEGGKLQNKNDCVSLRLVGESIVARKNLDDMFTATLTLSEKGECRLKINGAEHECWRVRQMLLEDLFFNIV